MMRQLECGLYLFRRSLHVHTLNRDSAESLLLPLPINSWLVRANKEKGFMVISKKVPRNGTAQGRNSSKVSKKDMLFVNIPIIHNDFTT